MKRAPTLTTPAQARDILGRAEYGRAVLSGELRRVSFAGTLYALGPDLDDLCRKRRPHWLARLIHPQTKGTPQ